MQVIYTKIILVIGMKENDTNNVKSNQEEQLKKEPDQENKEEKPAGSGFENEQKNQKKIDRCEPCLHCGSHCIYLNRE